MDGNRSWTKGGGILAVALMCLAGCEHFEESRAPWFGDSGAHLSPRQAADVQVALGRSLEKQGQVDQAMNAYHEAIRRDPRRTDAYWRLAILHDEEGHFKESAELFRKALRTSAGNADIYCDMGYSLYLQRRWAEAEMNLKQALVLKPDHARAHNNLGLVLAHSDRVEEALAQFRKAGPEADAQVNLALALAMDGRWPEARDHYRAALAANPRSAAAESGLRQLDYLVARNSPDSQPVVWERSPLEMNPASRTLASLSLQRTEPQRQVGTLPPDLCGHADRYEPTVRSVIQRAGYRLDAGNDRSGERVEPAVSYARTLFRVAR
jgi:tetratricopeptide (TPR) repeat protein